MCKAVEGISGEHAWHECYECELTPLHLDAFGLLSLLPVETDEPFTPAWAAACTKRRSAQDS
eukprot:1563321-Amphidinium_carterae.3